jgi:hypothetical protein
MTMITMTVVVMILGLMAINAALGGTALSDITIAVEMTVQGVCIIETHKTTVQGVPVMICKMVVGLCLLVLAVEGPIRALPML